MPTRYDAFNMGFSQASPGFRNSVISHHIDTDMPSHGYDFNRMMQQHLSDGYRSNLHNIQENEQDENAENPETPDNSPQHHSFTAAMTGSVIKRASHREGPMSSSNRGLFQSLSQTGTYEPMGGDLTTADMCLSKEKSTEFNQIFICLFITSIVFSLIIRYIILTRIVSSSKSTTQWHFTSCSTIKSTTSMATSSSRQFTKPNTIKYIIKCRQCSAGS